MSNIVKASVSVSWSSKWHIEQRLLLDNETMQTIFIVKRLFSHSSNSFKEDNFIYSRKCTNM